MPPAANRPSQPPAPPPKQAAPQGHVLSDAPLPFGVLKQADADLQVSFGTLQAGTDTARDMTAEAHLAGGKLGMRAHGVFAGGAMDAAATADANLAAPAVTLALNAPALPSANLLAALGARPIVSGTIAATANLRASGQSEHALASTLDGTAAVSMGAGRISTQMLERALGPAIARANPLAVLGQGESTELRCLVTRAVASKGQVRLDPLLLSSALLTVSGEGSVNLAAETLDLHLRPEGRAGSVAFSVPVTIAGSWRAPRIEAGKSAGGPAAALLGLLKGAEVSRAPSCAEAMRQAAKQG